MANQNEGDKEQKLSSWGLVQPAVLILIMEEPRHGYALLEELKTRGFLPNSADGGNVYRGLRKMEAEGKVISRWVHFDGKGPRRRIYQITQKGKDSLYEEGLGLAERAKFIELFVSQFRRIFSIEL